MECPEDVRFLQQRFPGFCPYHILHNLLGLHYSRHGLCTATPFSDGLCQHGSHQRPCLSEGEMSIYAPAEGALILLPFGLSRRASDGLLVAGCADCEQLLDGDTCGSCRRRWSGGRPTPAWGYTDQGRYARLTGWRAAIGLAGQGVEEGEPAGGWGESKEEWGEEECKHDEVDEKWDDDGGEGDDAAGGDAASWVAEGDGNWDGDDGPAGGADGGTSAGDWGAGCWVEDPHGSWSWVVDFAAPAAASAAPALGAQAPDVAAVASSAATAAVQAVLAAEAMPAAPGCCFRAGRL